MPSAHHPDPKVTRLLEGAAKLVQEAPYCWLAAAAEGGPPVLRPMGKVGFEFADHWAIRFLTDKRSGKVSNIRRASLVSIVFQREADDGYLTLAGQAMLLEDPDEVRARWHKAYNTYFPTEEDRFNAVFLTVAVTRIELWIRGLTDEPFGMKTTTLEHSGAWRLVA